MHEQDGVELTGQISARIDLNLHQAIRDTAARDGISRSDLIRKLMILGYDAYITDPVHEHPEATRIINGLYGNISLVKELREYRDAIVELKNNQAGLAKRLREAQTKLRYIERQLKLW